MTDSSSRTPSQRYAATLGRLRAALRAPAVDAHAALALAHTLGREAHAAGLRLELLVELLASIVPADVYRDRTLPSAIVEAGSDAYLTESERPRNMKLE